MKKHLYIGALVVGASVFAFLSYPSGYSQQVFEGIVSSISKTNNVAQVASSGTLIEAVRIQQIGAPATGPVFVSSGLLLPKGKLRSSDVPNIAVRMNGTEVQSYTVALQGTHSDGTLKSVLIQFTVPLANVNDPIRIELGGRSTPQLPRVEPNGEPKAILLPDNPDSVINSGLFGPTVKRSSVPQSPSYFQKYESDFDKFEQQQWSSSGWGPNDFWRYNYYDRALAYFAFWARTRNPLFFERGAGVARSYEQNYGRPNNYTYPVWQGALEGQVMHYWLTGYELSRDSVIHYMTKADIAYGQARLSDWQNHPWMDNRTQKVVLGTKILALQLGANSSPSWSGAPGVKNIRASAMADLDKILSTQQPNGSYRFVSSCQGSSNFMTGLLNGVLGQYYNDVSPDPRIITALEKSYDWLFTTQWDASKKAFKYYELNCPGHGGPTVAGDLNGLFLSGLGFLYEKTNNPKWYNYGEQLFEGTVTNSFASGMKQFNQQYQDSWRWLGYRVGVNFTGQPPVTYVPPVTPPVTPPTVSLSASNSSITLGQSTTLTWSSTNATSCTAGGGWSGSAALSGSQSVSPTQTTTYSLNCGSASQAVTITVTQPVQTPTTPPPPVVTTPPPPVVVTPPSNPPPSTTPVANTPSGGSMADTFPPSVPSKITAFTSNKGELTVRWDPSFDRGGIEGYRVFRDGSQIATVPREEYVDKGLTPGRTYEYTVVSIDRSGNTSEQSSAVGFKPSELIITESSSSPAPIVATPTVIFNRNMAFTQQNSDILALQILLQKLGYFSMSVEPNGYFGRHTLASVIRYQKAKGISVTGFVGPLTRASLNLGR